MRVAMETPYKRGRVAKGIIGSAFEFNKEIDRLVWARKTFGNVSEKYGKRLRGGNGGRIQNAVPGDSRHLRFRVSLTETGRYRERILRGVCG